MKGLAPLVVGIAVALAPGDVSRAEPPRRIVSAAPEGSPWAEALAEAAREITARTAGRLHIKSVHGAVAGDEVDTAQACARGKGFLWGGSAGAFARVVAELDTFELPFLFEDDRQVDAVLHGRPMELLVEAFGRAGLVLVPVLSEVGWRSFAGQKPLRSPADLRGLRVRSQESPIHQAMWRALGARPQVISMLDTLVALEGRLVDAFDQSPTLMFAASWHLQARYYTLSRHIYQPGVLVVCKGALAEVSAADRKVLMEVATTGLRKMRATVRVLSSQVMDRLVEHGLQLVPLTPAERADFREQTRSVHASFLKTATPLGRELVAAIKRVLREPP